MSDPATGGRSGAVLTAATGRPAQIAAAIGALAYLAYYVCHFHLSTVWPPRPTGDAGILLSDSLAVLRHGGYAPAQIFPYSPSAVLLLAGLGAAGAAVFAVAWWLLMAAGFVGSVAGGLAQERTRLRAAWPLLGALAVLATNGPISWDLRNWNSNLVCLGLAMAGFGLLGRRPALGGALVALGVSLKIYSGLLLVLLLVNGPRRAFWGGAAAMAVLWMAAPLLVFGPAGTEQLYIGWLGQVRVVGDPATVAALAATGHGPPIVTLRRALEHLAGAPAGSPAIQGWLYGLWAVWIAGLAFYAWRWLKRWRVGAPSRALLADWVVALLAPLPFSPWLEPYHAVPVLAGALLCATVAADAREPRADRLLAGAAVIVLIAFGILHVPFELRGLGLLTQFLTLTIILGVLRPTLAAQPADAPLPPKSRDGTTR